MSQRFRVPTQLAESLRQLGVSPEAVLAHAGLPGDLLRQPRIMVLTEEFFAIWRAISEVSRDPAIGLKLGSVDPAEVYDPISIATLCARSFGDSLERMARYKQLTCPEEIVLRRRASECTVQFRWLLAQDAEPALLVDLCFAWVLSIARRGIGEPIAPLRLELDRPARNRQIFEKFFGCGIRFDARHNAIVFRTEDLHRPYRTYNAEMLSMLAPALEEELNRRVAVESLPDRVRGSVRRRLAGQRPSVRDVARDLNMSARTLQRRLLESGLSFQQVVESARRELARHYLVHSPLEIGETAYLLGYGDANSFVRAFHEWEGVPPAHWREAQRGKSIPAGVQ
ncbi:MAG TPA: AraC family transcriptional regulator [Bryobacteraceae bacterium]|nr:AraC family transcriptional regulator [Bryobacteraceae bacterium]